MNLNGRLRRRGWCGRTALTLLLFIVIYAVALPIVGYPRRTGNYGSVHLAGVCLSPPFEVIWFVLSVRRLHDLNRSGWWLAPAYVAAGVEMTLLAFAGWYTPGSTLHRFEDTGIVVQAAHWLDTLTSCVVVVALALWPGSRAINRYGMPNMRPDQNVTVFD